MHVGVSSLSAGFGREVPKVVGVISGGLRDGSGRLGSIALEGGTRGGGLLYIGITSKSIGQFTAGVLALL